MRIQNEKKRQTWSARRADAVVSRCCMRAWSMTCRLSIWSTLAPSNWRAFEDEEEGTSAPANSSARASSWLRPLALGPMARRSLALLAERIVWGAV